MSVGFVTTKGTIDAEAGQLAQNIQGWARSATNLHDYLDTLTTDDLVALGYTTDDVALLKSASGDMAQLAAVFYGQVEQTPAYDFRTFIQRIGGLQL